MFVSKFNSQVIKQQYWNKDNIECQLYRQPGDDNRMLVCDLCDTGYHTYCLDPPMSTIPKTGWKCLVGYSFAIHDK